MTSSFAVRQNIIRYLQLLQHETDLEKKRILLRLVGEEQAKMRALLSALPGQPTGAGRRSSVNGA